MTQATRERLALSVGDSVRVVSGPPGEIGAEGVIFKLNPLNGDLYDVRILKGNLGHSPHARAVPGDTFTYKADSLVTV